MQMGMMMPMTKVVKWLMIVSVTIWLVFQVIIEKYFLSSPQVTYIFGLVPLSVIKSFYIWQFATYIFLHSLNPMHILFNMLLLWWLGSELEQRWGSKFFLTYFMVSGIGAGVIYTAIIFLHGLITGSFSGFTNPVIGASGAVFGLMLAYGMIFGERVVYFMMIFPMKAKFFVIILGAMEVVTLLNSGIGGSDVANLAHLGGIAAGYMFLKSYTLFQQSKWRKQSSGRGRGLRLVVNNDRKEEKKDGDGPKYWN